MRNASKIRPEHLSRKAYVYVRQSSPGQVMKNTESARRQRDLAKLAESLGWPASKIEVLDDDQGKSGQAQSEREAFKQIVGEVCVGEVGIILGLQVSRLARNSADWFPLLEMCKLTETLIADEEGVYDVNDRNDCLGLGVKGIFSEAELAGIRAQLQGARWSRARRGDLRRRIPAGYVYDDQDKAVMDPDERVRSAFRSFFSRFREIGSALGVARAWQRDGLLFPRRSNGRWAARVQWRLLGVRHASYILHNPFYAGAYVYGMHRWKTILDPETRSRKTVIERVPMESWEVLIPKAHEGYISWEEFLQNQQRLKENWNVPEGSPGVARGGDTLLQGIVYCGKCGRRMRVRYSGKKQYPSYLCQRQKFYNGEGQYCSMVATYGVDRFVEEKLLEAIEPVGIEAAIGAVEELERRAEDLRRQWQHRIEQAQYEAGLAQRRYEAVDPANRLVAGNLERDWEEKLQGVEKLRKEYEERLRNPPLRIDAADLERIRELSRDIPRLWHSKGTKASQRKEIVRILIRDVWLSLEDEPRGTRIRIHWQTGAVTEGKAERRHSPAREQRTPESVVTRVRQLNDQLLGPKAIAEQLNREGIKTGGRVPFTPNAVCHLLKSRNITTATRKRKLSRRVEEVTLWSDQNECETS